MAYHESALQCVSSVRIPPNPFELPAVHCKSWIFTHHNNNKKQNQFDFYQMILLILKLPG